MAGTEAASSKPGDFQGAMLEPSPVNNNWVRLAAVLGGVALAARSTSFWSGHAVVFAHLLAFGVFLGSNVWVTFIAGITMFKTMPRQMFGKVQAKLFPKYFAIGVSTTAFMLGSLAFGPALKLTQPQLIALGVALVASLLNWFIVEPAATHSMFERYALENSSGPKDAAKIKTLKSQFGKWHGLSSSLSLAALVGVMSHGWWLASHMV